MMDIKIFIYGGGQGALSVQKTETNQQNSTHSKIKLYIIFLKKKKLYD